MCPIIGQKILEKCFAVSLPKSCHNLSKIGFFENLNFENLFFGNENSRLFAVSIFQSLKFDLV